MTNTFQNQLLKMQELSEISESFLQIKPNVELDYQYITDQLLIIAEAKFAAFNLHHKNTDYFQTVALSGDFKSIETAIKLSGYDFKEKKWLNDLDRIKIFENRNIVHFKTLAEYAGKYLTKTLCNLLQLTFNLGEVVLVKIMVNHQMLGEFILIFEKDKQSNFDSIIEIYTRQVGMILARKDIENSLMNSEINFKAIFEKGPIGIAFHKIILDKDNQPIDYLFLDANASFKELTGVDPIGLMVTQAFLGIEHASFNWIQTYGKIAQFGGEIRFQQYLEANNRWYDCFAYQYKQDHFVVLFFEITKNKEKENSFLLHEELHKEIISNISDAILIIDKKRLVKYQSSNCLRIFGWNTEDLVGDNYYNFIHPDDILIIRNFFYSIISGEIDRASFECRVKDKIGNFRTVDILAIDLFNNPGINGILVTFHDISQRKLSELSLIESEERLRLITDNVSDVISVINLSQQKTIYVSPSIYQQRGFTIEEAMHETIKDSMNTESWIQTTQAIERHSKEFLMNPTASNNYISEIQQFHKDGSLIWIEISAKYQLNKQNELELLIVSRNINERKKVELERVFLNYHDHLTGLYNRRFFEEELIRLDTQRNLPISIIMADINGLKLINDSFGHSVGDQLLITASGVIKSFLREDEIFARLGGDEFAILLPRTDHTSTEEILSRISLAIGNEKIANIQLSISFGFSTKSSIEESLGNILKNAEDTMYRSKLYESKSSRNKTIEIILNALFEKSKREQLHSHRVSLLCEKLAQELGYRKDHVNQIKIAGLVHDIGKIGIDESILNKEDHLTIEEWVQVLKHPEAGWRILNSANEFSELSEFILTHHERFDGSGYPRGISGNDIPIEARIIAIADAYDAMTSKRSYRGALSKEEACQELIKCSNTQFDPQLVEVFLKII